MLDSQHLAMNKTPIEAGTTDRLFLGNHVKQQSFERTLGTSESTDTNDPSIYSYDVLRFTGNEMLQLQTESPTPQGMVLAFDIRPYQGGNPEYAILSLRSRDSKIVSMYMSYSPTSQTISIDNRDSGSASFNRFFTSSALAPLGTFDRRSVIMLFEGEWTRVVVELVTMAPSELPDHFAGVRVWINGVLEGPSYFASSVASQQLLMSTTTPTLELGVRRQSGTDALLDWGSLDIVNFVWVRGVEMSSLATTSTIPIE